MNLPQTVDLNHDLKTAETNLNKAKEELSEFTKELPGGKAPTAKDYIHQKMAVYSWVVLAIVQAAFTVWILYALTQDLVITVFGTLGFLVFLEGPGIIISYLCNLRKKEMVSEVKHRLGIVVACMVMLAVATTLAVMAGYRAYLVNQDELIAAKSSQIVAQEDQDSYQMSVAQEIELQTNDRIRYESIFFAVLEAGMCSLETVLALFIPAYLASRGYWRRKDAADKAETIHDNISRQRNMYVAQEHSGFIQRYVDNGGDLAFLRNCIANDRSMLGSSATNVDMCGDFGAFVYKVNDVL